MIPRRLLLQWAGVAALTSADTRADWPEQRITPAYSASVFQYGRQSLSRILDDIFESHDAGEDASIHIDLPQQAQHPLRIPFRITARGADRLAIIVADNPQPLLMAAEIEPLSGGVVIGTFQAEHAATLSVYALKQGLLHVNHRSFEI